MSFHSPPAFWNQLPVWSQLPDSFLCSAWTLLKTCFLFNQALTVITYFSVTYNHITSSPSILPSLFHLLPKQMHVLQVLCRVLPAWHTLPKIFMTVGACVTTAFVQRGRQNQQKLNILSSLFKQISFSFKEMCISPKSFYQIKQLF